MIEDLDGMKETVRYHTDTRVKLYYNVEMEGYPTHWHSASEIIMPLRNEYTVIPQGREIVLQRGDILLIPPGTLHEIRCPEEHGDRLIINFDPTVMNINFGMASLTPFYTPYHLVTAESDPALHDRLQDILASILRTFYTGGDFKHVAIYADLMRFMSVLGNAFLERSRHEETALDLGKDDEEIRLATQQHISVIYDCCEFLRAHSREDITLEDLADRAGFSKYYFSRLFKAFTKVGFVDYLNRCRVLDASTLLSDPESVVTEVAMDVGFKSISTFNRVFKKYKGCTPSEFRKLSGYENYGGRLPD